LGAGTRCIRGGSGHTESPEALDGLGRSLWWLRDERGAVVQRERAYAGFRRDGEFFVDERIAEGVRGGCFRYFEAFPDLHIALDDVIAEGDRVFVRSTMTRTHDGEYKGIPPTGRHVAAESAEIFRVADGAFVGYWCLTNVAGLMRQLTEDVAVAPA
jgi:predicted ester cyclase